MNRPTQVSPKRWQQVIADADRLLEDLGDGWSWAKELAALDWAVEDVFGRDDLDRQSLVWKVQGQLIGPITKIAAVLRGTDGSTTWVYRRVET